MTNTTYAEPASQQSGIAPTPTAPASVPASLSATTAPSIAPPAATEAPLVVAAPRPPIPTHGIPGVIARTLATDAPTVTIAGLNLPTEPLRLGYEARGYRPIWVSSGGLNEKAEALVAMFANADRDGLDPALYRLTDMTPGAVRSDESLGLTELAFTAALLRYANDVGVGRWKEPDVAAAKQERTIDIAAILAGAGSAQTADAVTSFTASLAPSDGIYLGLRAALLRYRALRDSGDWAPLPPGFSLTPGGESKQLPALRRMLVKLGDLQHGASETSTHADEQLVGAIKQFQRRHNIRATGAIDGPTREAFNTSLDLRIRQILVNMERRRHMPGDLGNPYVLVNLPDFRLDVVENGRSVLDMRVVIGKATWPTPVFSDEIAYLEFNPYWNVPPGILKKEVLPGMRANPGYARAKGLRVFEGGQEVEPSAIDWSRGGASRYSFRQDPGPRNALGKIKFMLPNEYDVYLHDTPQQSYFARQMRAFSHGCVRVERPKDLALYLLERNGDGWNKGRIDQKIASRRNAAVALKTPMSVHLAYFTVWQDAEGHIQFRPDVYGIDSVLERDLFASAD